MNTRQLLEMYAKKSRNSPVPHEITVGDILDMVENIEEQGRQQAEAARVEDWLGKALDLAETVGEEQKKFAEWCAEVGEYPTEEGTYPSPYISGGEVFDPTPCKGSDDIPF